MPIWLTAAVVSAVLAFVGGWQVNGWRHDAARLAQVERDAKDAFKRVELVDKASEGFEVGQADADQHKQGMQKEIIRVVTKTEYRERCLDDDGMRILTANINASNARRQLAPAVPASGPASGPEQGRRPTVGQ